MPQEILDLLARLNELTVEELSDLEGRLVAYFNEQRDIEDRTPEVVAAMQEARDRIAEVRTQRLALEEQAAEMDRQAAALDAEVNGDTEGDGDGENAEGENAEGAEGAEGENAEGGTADTGGEAAPEAVAAGGAPAGGRPAMPPRPRPLAEVTRNAGGRTQPPARTQPRAPRRALIAAGATDPLGERRELAGAILHRLDSIRGTRVSVEGERVLVASANWMNQYPEERRLREGVDPQENANRLEAIVGQQALTAAGGMCAPFPVDYGIDVIGDTVRPVRDALPAYGADRGGVQWITPPTLPNVAGSSILWTNANDAAPGTAALATPVAPTLVASAGGTLAAGTVGYRITARNALGETLPGPEATVVVTANQQVTISWPAIAGASSYGVYGRTAGAELFLGAVTGTTAFVDSGAITPAGALPTSNTTGPTGPATKPCIEVACGVPAQALVEAIPSCLQFSNFRGRFNPEQVAANVQLAAVLHAQIAEAELLRQMRAKSIAVTAAQLLGVSRDLLSNFDLIAARYRDIYRIQPGTVRLQAFLPHWTHEAVRIDLARAAYPFEGDVPGTSLGITNEQIDEWIRSRGIDPTYYLDSDVGSQQLGAQAAGTIVQLPTVIRMLVFRAGTFQFLDGGQLNLGVVRDSTLNSVNKYQQWSETFEGVAFRGIESLDVAMTYKANGATAGTLTPA